MEKSLFYSFNKFGSESEGRIEKDMDIRDFARYGKKDLRMFNC